MLSPASSCLDEQILLALVSGALTAQRLRVVEAHVSQCLGCQRLVAEVGSSLDSTVATTTDHRAGSHERGRPRADARSSVGKSSSQQLPLTGEVLGGKYRVDGWLGRGGMGSVMRATHLGLGQRVAIKILHILDPDAVARFMREGRTLAQLHSQHIVRVYDSGNLDDSTPFIVMEYLDGCDLAELLRSGSLEPHMAIRYVRQACRALETSHAAGIVHRDLKPSNLFLAKLQDGNTLIKVLDFGISKHTTREDYAETLTATGAVIGSPRYMSPEQVSASHQVDRAADIWSLGVILYEVLTGRAPFDQTSITALLVAIATQRPAPLRQIQPSLPIELEAIVLRCLEKEPARRFASVAELSAALARYEAPFEHATSKANTLKLRAPLAVLALTALAIGAWASVRYWAPQGGAALVSSVEAASTPPETKPAVDTLAPAATLPSAAGARATTSAAPSVQETQPSAPSATPKREHTPPPSATKPTQPTPSRIERRPTPAPKQLGPLDTPD